MKLKWLFTAFLLLFAGSVFAQTKVTVFKNDGAQQEFVCSEFSELGFENSNLVIIADIRTNDIGIAIPRSEIRKITFTEFATIVENQSITSLEIYPNPAKSQIAVAGTYHGNFNYEIFSLDGRKIAAGRSENGNLIDISQLNAGVYFVRIDNNILKLIKQ